MQCQAEHGERRALVVVDNVRSEADVINRIPPSEVAGMELYPREVSAPMPFRSTCGTVMIWTKR